MGDVPTALRRDGRPIDAEFLPGEELYFRVSAVHIHGEHVSPASIRVPAQSVDRQKYCPVPDWVLVPGYEHWGVAKFFRGDVPDSMVSPSPGNVRYRFTVEHVPEDENYAHSEIRAYKGDQALFDQKLQINDTVKKTFKMQLADKMRIIQRPQPTR